MAKMDCGARKMNLLQKYQVSKHLDNLHRRFGEEPFRRESMRLEDIAGPLDEDVAPILEFREAVDRNDRLKMKRGNVRAQVLVKLKRDWIMEQIVQGKSAPAIAEELDIPVGSLRWYVQKDSELKKVYRMMRGRRGYMSEDTAVKIRKMLSEGYTHAVIVATLHVTPSQVEYQQSKRKAGLV